MTNSLRQPTIETIHKYLTLKLLFYITRVVIR